MSEIIKGFKGFNSDWTCKDFKFEVGKEFEIPKETEIKIYNSGFHFCKNPLDIFKYYKAGKSKFAEVEGMGDEQTHNEDSKVSVRKIKIKAEIKLPIIIKAGIEFIWERVKAAKPKSEWASGNYSTGAASGNYSTGAASGYYSTGAASGNYSTGAASGYYSTGAASGYYSTGAASGNSSTGAASGNYSTGAASGNSSTGAASGYSSTGAASGNYSTGAASGDSSTGAASGNSSTGAASGNSCKAKVTGKDSIAIANGVDSKVMASLGSWIVASEYSNGELINVKSAKIDGTILKADTFYKLVNNEFVEAK
jgi:hypothetical protein